MNSRQTEKAIVISDIARENGKRLADLPVGITGQFAVNVCTAIVQNAIDDATENLFPVFDILERLYVEGYTTKLQDGRWWLFDPSGDGIVCGKTFRALCTNIVLAGL